MLPSATRRACAVCGRPLPRRRNLYCSDECRKKAKLSRLQNSKRASPPAPLPPKTLVCASCGVSFPYRPNASLCTACQLEAKKRSSSDYARRRAHGQVRALGSTDLCEVCGGRYTVTGSHQKVCPDCRVAARLAQQRAAERKRRQTRKGDPLFRAHIRDMTKILPTKRVCQHCGTTFVTSRTNVFCSKACAAACRSTAPQDNTGALPRKRNASPLSSLRFQKGLTQHALARMLGVTQSAVSRWENGLPIPPATRKRLDQILTAPQKGNK